MITIEYWKDDHRFTYSHDDYEPDRVEFSSLSRHDINEPTFIKTSTSGFLLYGFFNYEYYGWVAHRPDKKPVLIRTEDGVHVEEYYEYGINYLTITNGVEKYEHNYDEYKEFKDSATDTDIILNIHNKNKLIERFCKHKLKKD